MVNYKHNHINIDKDTIWNSQHLINRDVVIDSGYTLTISGEVWMVETSRIIVEPGAKLIIDGGHITGMCNRFWNGIEEGVQPILHRMLQEHIER